VDIAAHRPHACAFALAVIVAALCASCEDDPSAPAGPDNGGPPLGGLDTLAPATINTLVCKAPGTGSLALQWVAPGDDGWTGTAAAYDIRYSRLPISDQSWDTAIRGAHPPEPVPGNKLQVIRVTGLDANTLYYFAVKTRDEVANESGMSNVAYGVTLQEVIPPAYVTDLAAVAIDSVLFSLTWTAPGDDGVAGTASAYDVRFAYRPIDDSTWDGSTAVGAIPEPKPAGQPETLIVAVPSPNRNYAFALKTADEVPNWSDLSNAALGLGYGSYLFAVPDVVHAGENLWIVFRAPGGRHVRVELSRFDFRVCGQGDIVLMSSVLTEGIYTLTYDFYDPDQQTYEPADWYHILVCIDGLGLGYDRVQFVR
jgi:hypothetical protein